jgi:hypothetical protein
MSGSGIGLGQFGSPGYVSPFDMNAVNFGQGQSMTAMGNRYQQLGLSGQGATPTSSGGAAGGGGGASPDPSSSPTAELMDLGQAPSLTGGIPEQFQALLGQIQTSALQNASMAGAGSGKGGGGKGGGLGSVAPLLAGGK